MGITITSTRSNAIAVGLEETLGAVVRAVTPPTPLFVRQASVISATGNWTRPANSGPVVKLILIGGGGAGGCGVSWSHNGSGGGGAGQLVERWLDISSVAIGGTIPVTIGNFGAAVGGNSNGNNGGNSSFGSNGNAYYVISAGFRRRKSNLI